MQSKSNTEIKYECKQCGRCCQHLEFVRKPHKLKEPVRHLAKGFPFKVYNGVCEMFKDGKCSCYNSRPLLCNVEKMWEVYYSHLYTKEQWFQHNKLGCEVLIAKTKKQ